MTCPDCPETDDVGPSLSENALALIGDFSLETPSSVVSFQQIATSSPRSHFLYLPEVNSGDPQPLANAVTNTALAAIVPTVIATQPRDLYQGATMDVVVLGGKTNFLPSSTVSFSGGDIVVNSQSVISPSELLVNITVARDAEVGFRDITVTTPLGSGTVETASGAGQTRVRTDNGAARITAVQPSLVARGSTVDLRISGLNTDFEAPILVDIPGFTINSVEVLTPTLLRVSVTVLDDANLGFQDISLFGGASSVFADESLTVLESLGQVLGLPMLTGVSPGLGTRGSTLSVTVTGENTNFIEGVSVASFSNPGISVLSTAVNSSTQATVELAIDADAALGFSDVTMTTGSEIAVLLNGFRIEDGCRPDAMNICLNSERFRVEVEWTDFVGESGSARVVPFGSDDSGLFYFFSPNNWEMLVKVLDGCDINDRFWVFSAATTNVEYTLRVTDTATGTTMSYLNPLGTAAPALTDTDAFATCSAGSRTSGVEKVGVPAAVSTIESVAPAAEMESGDGGMCIPTSTNMCLNADRFRVEVVWRDFIDQTGDAMVVPFGSEDSGLFWFFEASNWEMLIKVLDGCAINDNFWVFSAATTNVEYTLRVTDTQNGTVKEYFNPLGNAADAITDTLAFPCP